MKIVHIQYPYIITDTGDQIAIDAINGHPKIGSELIPEEFELGGLNGYYKISAVTSDSECVSGVCPIK